MARFYYNLYKLSNINAINDIKKILIINKNLFT
jgi:hypothetical protein